MLSGQTGSQLLPSSMHLSNIRMRRFFIVELWILAPCPSTARHWHLDDFPRPETSYGPTKSIMVAWPRLSALTSMQLCPRDLIDQNRYLCSCLYHGEVRDGFCFLLTLPFALALGSMEQTAGTQKTSGGIDRAPWLLAFTFSARVSAGPAENAQ